MSKKIVKILDIASTISSWAVQNKSDFINYEWTSLDSVFAKVCILNYVIHLEVFIRGKQIIESVINVYQDKEHILSLSRGSEFMFCILELNRLFNEIKNE